MVVCLVHCGGSGETIRPHAPRVTSLQALGMKSSFERVTARTILTGEQANKEKL